MSVLVNKGTGSGWSCGLWLSGLLTVCMLPAQLLLSSAKTVPDSKGYIWGNMPKAISNIKYKKGLADLVPPSTTIVQHNATLTCPYFLSIMWQHNRHVIPDTSGWKTALFFYFRTIAAHRAEEWLQPGHAAGLRAKWSLACFVYKYVQVNAVYCVFWTITSSAGYLLSWFMSMPSSEQRFFPVLFKSPRPWCCSWGKNEVAA